MIYSTNLLTIKLSFCWRSDLCVACNLMVSSHLGIHRWDVFPHPQHPNQLSIRQFCPHAKFAPDRDTPFSEQKSVSLLGIGANGPVPCSDTGFFIEKCVSRGKALCKKQESRSDTGKTDQKRVSRQNTW